VQLHAPVAPRTQHQRDGLTRLKWIFAPMLTPLTPRRDSRRRRACHLAHGHASQFAAGRARARVAWRHNRTGRTFDDQRRCRTKRSATAATPPHPAALTQTVSRRRRTPMGVP